MKVFTNLCIYLLIFSLFSCRETSENASENVEKQPNVELLQKETDSLDQLEKANIELNDQLDELDKAIKDLDNN